MPELEGGAAFAAIANLLSGGDPGVWRGRSPSIERLRQALTEYCPLASGLDLAVLLRQVLRYEHARRECDSSPVVLIRHPGFADFASWAKAGLEVIQSPDGIRVSAAAWRPNWLKDAPSQGVDFFSSSETVCRAALESGVVGDPFLKAVGRSFYRSPGQRAAVRAALTTPKGGTLVIALPTGEGKSMIFQLAQSVGFCETHHADVRGVTLVIVPTVALGINHELEAVAVCGLSKPLAFQGGNESKNALIAERIGDGSQGLCFASPEAACGTLRHSLRRAAEAGFLRALVVDEAHIIDQWGTDFRTEFQELSGLRRELLAAAHPDHRMRTFLLSATLTDSSLETLRSLFGTDGRFESIAAVQLRPEPDYWVAPTVSDQQRIDHVTEALHHVPRPAVLYVTKVADANAWYDQLRMIGFKRIRKLHGKTGREDRENVVDEWRNGLVDIVVATSAFGLGIDYPHARSVIHACVPETLDRFYQEVGRGGRDGRASLSLIVPTQRDFLTARAINKKTVISVQRGFERWNAMFYRKLDLKNGHYAVRIDGRPGAGVADIDMFGDANTDWNLRTLALMARAGLINLLGSPYPRLDATGDWLEIDILDEAHLTIGLWQTSVEPVRRAEWLASERNLALMGSYLKDARCPAKVLEDLYGSSRLGRVCSRCQICRGNAMRRLPFVPVGEPRSPWFEPINTSLARLLGADGRLLVTYKPDQLARNASRRLGESFSRLQKMGVAKLLLLGRQPFDMDRVLSFAEKVPFFVSAVPSLAYSRLPQGTEVVMVAPEETLEPLNLVPWIDTPRIFLVSDEFLAPDGRRLVDVFGGRRLTLDEFHARVAE